MNNTISRSRWTQAEREEHREREAAIERRIEQQLRASLTASVQALVAEEHRYMMEQILPELVAEMRHAISDEICTEIERAYKLALIEVRADLNALRAAVAKLGGLSGEPIDLPAMLLRHPPLN
jgi:hypothetical protein